MYATSHRQPAPLLIDINLWGECMNKWLCILLLIVGCSLHVLMPVIADDDEGSSNKESLVKAAFLYNFSKYTQWPDGKSVERSHALNICTIGNDDFGTALDIFRKASSTQIQFSVERNVSDSNLAYCNILYIGKSDEARIPTAVAIAKSNAILTVSEASGFADQGGVIELVKVKSNVGLFSKDKINLRINLKTAAREGLRIDAQLLEIAAEVIR